LIIWALQNVPSKRAGLAAATLSFVASLFLIPMSSLEHSKSLSPSLLLNGYLFASFILDAAMLRTLWLSSFDLVVCGLFTASFGLKCGLVVLESVGKRRYFTSEYEQTSLEESSGLYSRSLFWWLNRLMVLGSRQVLRPIDLYPITKDMSSEELTLSFWKIWTKRKILGPALNRTTIDEFTEPKQGKYVLPKVLARLFFWQVLSPVFPRIMLIGFTFCQPLLLKRLLNYLGDPVERKSSNIGYGLIGAYGLVYLGIAVKPIFN
jgi:ATP-binding cassette subfamily C (CFTR/MRP) protein 1